MTKKKILFIGGSLNQTTIMHHISLHLSGFDCYFNPFCGDGLIKWMSYKGMLDFTVMGGNFRRQTDTHMKQHWLKVDFRDSTIHYELVVTSQDLIVQKNIIKKSIAIDYSGHETGLAPTWSAVSLGSSFVEKHVTLACQVGNRSGRFSGGNRTSPACQKHTGH